MLFNWVKKTNRLKKGSFLKRQTRGTSSDNEWIRMIPSGNEWFNKWQRMTTSDNDWQRVVQWMTMNGTTSDNEWQQMATSDNDWQRVAKSGTKNKNGTIYFKEWMIVFLSVTEIATRLRGRMADITMVK